MYRRTILTQEHILARVAVPVFLAIVGLLFTGCFQGQEEKNARTRTTADISRLSRPFSFGQSGGPSAGKTESSFPEDRSGLSFESRRFGAGISIFNDANPFGLQEAGQISGADFGMFVRASSENGEPYAQDAARPRAGSPPAPSRLTSAALYLDRPFSSLFANLFKRGNEAAESRSQNAAASAEEEAAANPFTEARQKAEAGTQLPKAAHEDAAPAKEGGGEKSAAADNPTAPSSPEPVAAMARPIYLFLGDFDGSGRLQAVEGERLGETTFLFPDAGRVFSLFVNPSAVENQRSFGVEDLNGDGIADLLATSRSSLFGGLLLGNPDGSYTVSDSFLTGYEPVVATAGPMENGRRDIVTVNVRSGEVNIFRPQPQYRRGQDSFLLGFVPDFICHLRETETGDDFFTVAQAAGAVQSFRWNEGHKLDPAEGGAPVVPGITLARDFLRKNSAATVQAYQVGPYASITLTNGRHQSYNIANLRVTPRVFIAVGEFAHAGTLDVAVAYLRGITPR